MQQHTVESEILAVTHLHTFLEELKNKAQQMLEVGGPVQRGFFTPDEDEQVVRYSNSSLAFVSRSGNCTMPSRGSFWSPFQQRYY